jgi:hypothetical protein
MLYFAVSPGDGESGLFEKFWQYFAPCRCLPTAAASALLQVKWARPGLGTKKYEVPKVS